MAAQIIAQISSAQIVGLPGGDPVDVENDSTPAAQGTVNVFVPPGSGNGSGTGLFLTLEPIAEAIMAALANGPCTIVISQGAGNVTYTATA